LKPSHYSEEIIVCGVGDMKIQQSPLSMAVVLFAIPAIVPLLIIMTPLSSTRSSVVVSAFVPSLIRRSTSIVNRRGNNKAAFSSTNVVISDSRSSFLFQKTKQGSVYNNHIVSSIHNDNDGVNHDNTTDNARTITNVMPEEFQNKNNAKDQIISAISTDGEIKVTAATTRNLANEVLYQQSLTAVPMNALARSMTCSLMLSNGMQDEQTFQLTMACDGPIRSVVSIAQSNGEVRGYVGSPSIGEMSLPEAIGSGTVQVVKNHPDWPNPYNGITAIRNGDIDRDVGIYLAESEQRSCALAAGITMKSSQNKAAILCSSSGGYVVEQLPGCSKETVQIVERNLVKLIERDGTKIPPTGILGSGGTPWDICAIILEGLGLEPLQQIEPKYVCKCTRERLFRAVRLLPREDVQEILRVEEQIEARCEFCGKVFRMGPKEVAKRFAEANGDPSLDKNWHEKN